ncbi:sigma-70 family RNA polymerase sigma factor [Actinoplanes sp. HUAS TT8]|uniref:sigma-70 family RNA polymerase sigma factor n=1 Tax=Actinoplanes sp. HUAS TT8 TaxID=3447453 RepID=UPI003F51B180
MRKDDARRRIEAARRGDRRAQDDLARAYLPLVYNVVGRALGGSPDVEDVVQETMLRVVRDLPGLRDPDSLRAWILTIAMRQVSEYRSQVSRAGEPITVPDTGADFEELAILRLRLSGERRQVAEAARWLDDEDRTVLALWWQEAAGEIGRADTAAALGTTAAYAAVRVQRMRGQLDRSRLAVAALEVRPRCSALAEVLVRWDGRPSPLWRKRIDRHVRDCRDCQRDAHVGVDVERLLVGCALVPVPATLTAVALVKGSAGARLRHSLRSHPVAVSAAAVAVLVAGGAAYAATPRPEQPIAVASAAPVVESVSPLPSRSSVAPSPSASSKAVVPAVTKQAGCGAGLANRWASWPMPNPKAAGLPNPARYAEAGSVTRDRVTCLEWQRAAAPGTYTFSAAKSYCAGLGLDGGGWHLPTRIELTSIVDSGRSGPAIDTTAFPGTPAQFFWTSTAWAVTKTPLRAWIINFYEGLASNGAYQDGAFRVRCVRSDGGGSGSPAYRVSGGTVTDPATGLVWQRATSAVMSAGAATSYCKSLDLGGRAWRLPSLTEVSSTVDDTRVAPAVSAVAFPGTVKKGWYWTSTTAAPEPGQRWALNYEDGYTNYRKITEGYARCVSSSSVS